jgi:hypothetical protein
LEIPELVKLTKYTSRGEKEFFFTCTCSINKKLYFSDKQDIQKSKIPSDELFFFKGLKSQKIKL